MDFFFIDVDIIETKPSHWSFPYLCDSDILPPESSFKKPEVLMSMGLAVVSYHSLSLLMQLNKHFLEYMGGAVLGALVLIIIIS